MLHQQVNRTLECIQIGICLLRPSEGTVGEQAICFAEFDPVNRSLRKISGLDGLNAPTYLAILKRGEDRILYTFERSAQGGSVVALLLAEEGARELSRFDAEWIGPCHISVSEKQDLVYCASYGKGNIAVFRILEDGGLRFLQKIQYEGHGARKDRQAVPHSHFAGDRDGQLYVADLGLDKVFIYDIARENESIICDVDGENATCIKNVDGENETLIQDTDREHDTFIRDIDKENNILIPAGIDIDFPAGVGPRHLVMAGVNREWLYVLTEMSAEVFALRKTEKGWDFLTGRMRCPGSTLRRNSLSLPTRMF